MLFLPIHHLATHCVVNLWLICVIYMKIECRTWLIIDSRAFLLTTILAVRGGENDICANLILSHVGHVFGIATPIELAFCATLSFNHARSNSIQLYESFIKCSPISFDKALLCATEHPR